MRLVFAQSPFLRQLSTNVLNIIKLMEGGFCQLLYLSAGLVVSMLK